MGLKAPEIGLPSAQWLATSHPHADPRRAQPCLLFGTAQRAGPLRNAPKEPAALSSAAASCESINVHPTYTSGLSRHELLIPLALQSYQPLLRDKLKVSGGVGVCCDKVPNPYLRSSKADVNSWLRSHLGAQGRAIIGGTEDPASSPSEGTQAILSKLSGTQREALWVQNCKSSGRQPTT